MFIFKKYVLNLKEVKCKGLDCLGKVWCPES